MTTLLSYAAFLLETVWSRTISLCCSKHSPCLLSGSTTCSGQLFSVRILYRALRALHLYYKCWITLWPCTKYPCKNNLPLLARYQAARRSCLYNSSIHLCNGYYACTTAATICARCRQRYIEKNKYTYIHSEISNLIIGLTLLTDTTARQ